MELRHLRYFIAVAEELHFGRAAERLHIAQPPLSFQIRQLEEEIGVRLFERTKRRVELTAAGEIFLREAHKTMAQLEQAVSAAQRASRGEVGHLVIGFIQSATINVLPGILQTFRDRFPEVDIKLREATPTQVHNDLVDGQIHIGFLRPPINHDALECEIVLSEPLLVALPKAHPLARQKKLALKSLAGERFILFPRAASPGFYDQLVSICREAGFSPVIGQEAVQMQTILGLVAGGMGVALIPASIRSLRSDGVMYREIRELVPKAEMVVAWRRDNQSPTLRAFLNVIQKTPRETSS
ncbi:MAG: LysR substrate-binding domain-containing protein [Blastocatellia bacterium]